MKTSAHTAKWAIVSEIELVYRSKVKASERPAVTSSKSAYSLALQHWDKGRIAFTEQFKIMLLNQSNQVLGIYEMSSGGICGTVVDIRVIFAAALKAAAVGIILFHNHPSGRTAPSEADRKITAKIIQAGRVLDIQVMDHLIMASESYYSFADNGEMH
ncbi:JAB domain-containing protein [Flavobacterium luteolum]|uniref:JAB domain-containing protein n=1 Tax=Flavobacterium luteolum TaxID=3003259 RepID=UPI00248D8393|nr:JAB domain-containing protein [Flavobacterium luteolum]